MYGDMFKGIAELAMIGMLAIAIAVPAGIVAIGCGIWWICYHVTIH